MKVAKRRRWQAGEIKLLRKHYPIGGAKRCTRVLPGRTYQAITMRARTMGLHWHGPMNLARLAFHYNAKLDVLTIEGVRYAGEIFRHLGNLAFPLDRLIKFRREFGTVRFTDLGEAP